METRVVQARRELRDVQARIVQMRYDLKWIENVISVVETRGVVGAVVVAAQRVVFEDQFDEFTTAVAELKSKKKVIKACKKIQVRLLKQIDALGGEEHRLDLALGTLVGIERLMDDIKNG